ncbi:hypothetical protein KR009_003720 [Drosophila setifemur]|nr:hypothetical protein KR009_003720 [Drosophila setifemur]
MYSTKETKSAAKAQKKTQKVAKKQQQQKQPAQQQQQQQQNLPNGNKMKSPGSAKSPQANNNNNNINNNNNNNNNSLIVGNNNSSKNNINSVPVNTTQKFREHYDAERRNQAMKTAANTLPGYENVPKMERSNSFSLRNKLSKFINHLTGSKENLSKTEDDGDSSRAPFTFTRSRSMILMRRPNRRSFIEPQLEQLSEEAEKSGDLTSPASPRKTSVADLQDTSPVPLRRMGSARTPTRRQSAQPFTSTPLEEVQPQVQQRKASLMSLNQTEPSNNPQLNFQKRRSNTLIASFKSTFSGLTGRESVEKKEKMNPKWSASLQSLQAIDNMVSYANMSFIDYDKFNGYEKQLERQQSLMSLAEQPLPTTQLPLPPTALTHSHSPSPLGDVSRTSVQLGSSLEESVRTVVMRRKRSKNSLEGGRSKTSLEGRNSMASLSSSYNLDTDYEHNLDRVHNVYRESLDSRTLELLNLRSRNSFIQDQAVLFDALNLEDGSVGRRCALCRSSSLRQQQQQRERDRDAVDGQGNPKKQVSPSLFTFFLNICKIQIYYF